MKDLDTPVLSPPPPSLAETKMSHTVTVTRTTTTTQTSAILLNIGYFKTVPGILKLLQIIIGIVVVSVVGHYIAYHKYQLVYRGGASYPHVPDHGLFIPELFFLLIATTCLIASFLLLLSCIISIATATILPKTVFEIVYHIAAMVLLLLSAIIYLIDIENEYRYKGEPYKARLAAAEVTFLSPLTLLYFLAAMILLCSTGERMARFNTGHQAYGWYIFASVLGIINSVLYGAHVFFAYRNFKSG